MGAAEPHWNGNVAPSHVALYPGMRADSWGFGVAGCPGDELVLADLAAGEALDHLGCFVIRRPLPVEVVAGDELAHADVGNALVAVGKRMVPNES